VLLGRNSIHEHLSETVGIHVVLDGNLGRALASPHVEAPVRDDAVDTAPRSQHVGPRLPHVGHGVKDVERSRAAEDFHRAEAEGGDGFGSGEIVWGADDAAQ